MPTPNLIVHIAATKPLEKWLGESFERLPSLDGKRVGTQPLTTHASLVSWQCHVIENHPGSGLYTVIAVEAYSRYTLLLPYAEQPSMKVLWADLVEAWVANLTEIMWEGGFIGDDQRRLVVERLLEGIQDTAFFRNTDPSVNGHVTDAEQWVRDTLARKNQAQLTDEQAFGLGQHINQMFKTAKNADGQKERFYPVPRFLDDGLYRFASGLAEISFPDGTPDGDFPNPYTEGDELFGTDTHGLEPDDYREALEELTFLDQTLAHYGNPQSIGTISELDGYLTAIVSAPEPVMPSTWIPGMWGEPDQQPEWESEDDVKKFHGIVFERMNRIADVLIDNPEAFYPIFSAEWETPSETSDRLGVEDWCAGYMRAISVGGVWDEMPDDQMEQLGLINAFSSDEELDKLRQLDPDSLVPLAHTIPAAASELHAYNLNRPAAQQTPPPQPVRSGPKVGRNDPCPCGSGKKYKKCCLH